MKSSEWRLSPPYGQIQARISVNDHDLSSNVKLNQEHHWSSSPCIKHIGVQGGLKSEISQKKLRSWCIHVKVSKNMISRCVYPCMFMQNIFSLPILGYFVHLKDPFFKKDPISWAGLGLTPNFNIFKSDFFNFDFLHRFCHFLSMWLLKDFVQPYILPCGFYDRFCSRVGCFRYSFFVWRFFLNLINLYI